MFTGVAGQSSGELSLTLRSLALRVSGHKAPVGSLGTKATGRWRGSGPGLLLTLGRPEKSLSSSLVCQVGDIMSPGQPALSPALISTCRTHAGIVFMIRTPVTDQPMPWLPALYPLTRTGSPSPFSQLKSALLSPSLLSPWLFMTEGVYVSTVTSTVTLTLPQNCCVPDTM